MMDMKLGHDVSMHSFVIHLKLLSNSVSKLIIRPWKEETRNVYW